MLKNILINPPTKISLLCKNNMPPQFSLIHTLLAHAGPHDLKVSPLKLSPISTALHLFFHIKIYFKDYLWRRAFKESCLFLGIRNLYLKNQKWQSKKQLLTEYFLYWMYITESLCCSQECCVELVQSHPASQWDLGENWKGKSEETFELR